MDTSVKIACKNREEWEIHFSFKAFPYSSSRSLFFLTRVFLITADTTGTESVYTVYEGHEIMFHISTMLPYSQDNKQQVPYSYIYDSVFGKRVLTYCGIRGK